MADTPKQIGYRMPAEWEEHEGTWLSWPHSPRTWAGNFGPIPLVFGEIVKALIPHENVHICVRDEYSEQAVRKLLSDRGIDSAQHIRFYHIPTNDAWARDHGPIFIVRDDTADAKDAKEKHADAPRVAMVHWNFNAWGGKYPPWDDDDAVPERIAEILKMQCYRPRMILEGGSIEVNGKGTLLTTECVLLNPNRNPQLSRKQIEDRLEDYLGARHVVWLGDGIAGDDTDGHIDDLSRFVNATTIATVVSDDPKDVNYKALHENWERLQDARDQDGGKFTIVKLPSPIVCRGVQHADRPADERLPASHANFLIANGAVLVPIFDAPTDKPALKILSDFFPGRKMVGINCKDLVGGYGAIHCVTQQQPT